MRLLEERARVPKSEIFLRNIALWDFWRRGPELASLAFPTIPLHKKFLAFRAPLQIRILGGINLVRVIDYITQKIYLGN